MRLFLCPSGDRHDAPREAVSKVGGGRPALVDHGIPPHHPLLDHHHGCHIHCGFCDRHGLHPMG